MSAIRDFAFEHWLPSNARSAVERALPKVQGAGEKFAARIERAFGFRPSPAVAEWVELQTAADSLGHFEPNEVDGFSVGFERSVLKRAAKVGLAEQSQALTTGLFRFGGSVDGDACFIDLRAKDAHTLALYWLDHESSKPIPELQSLQLGSLPKPKAKAPFELWRRHCWVNDVMIGLLAGRGFAAPYKLEDALVAAPPPAQWAKEKSSADPLVINGWLLALWLRGDAQLSEAVEVAFKSPALATRALASAAAMQPSGTEREWAFESVPSKKWALALACVQSALAKAAVAKTERAAAAAKQVEEQAQLNPIERAALQFVEAKKFGYVREVFGVKQVYVPFKPIVAFESCGGLPGISFNLDVRAANALLTKKVKFKNGKGRRRLGWISCAQSDLDTAGVKKLIEASYFKHAPAGVVRARAKSQRGS